MPKIYIFLCIKNRRYDSDFLTARKVLDSNRIGRLFEATISYDIHHPQLRENGNAHTEKIGSGGEFNNRGSHIIDQAILLFGLPEAVFADFSAFRTGSEVEDYVEVILYYADKRVRLKETDIAVQPQPAYVFHGLEGSFFKSRSDMQEERLLAGATPTIGNWCKEPENEEGVLYTIKDGKKIRETFPTSEGNYYNYFEAVYQTIRHDAPSPVTGLDGYKTMLVMDAVRQSVDHGMVISLNER